MDRELDEDTPNAGAHRFEKMVSGMYLGEVARRAIRKLAVRGASLLMHEPCWAQAGLRMTLGQLRGCFKALLW